MSPLIKSVQDGIEEIVKICSECKNLPAIVTIIGLPNSGKTFVRSRAIELLHKKGKKGWSGMSGDSIDRFPSVYAPEYFLVEDVPTYVSSDLYIKTQFNRLPDARVYIAQSIAALSTRVPSELSEYTMLIVNTETTRKRN